MIVTCTTSVVFTGGVVRCTQPGGDVSNASPALPRHECGETTLCTRCYTGYCGGGQWLYCTKTAYYHVGWGILSICLSHNWKPTLTQTVYFVKEIFEISYSTWVHEKHTSIFVTLVEFQNRCQKNLLTWKSSKPLCLIKLWMLTSIRSSNKQNSWLFGWNGDWYFNNHHTPHSNT